MIAPIISQGMESIIYFPILTVLVEEELYYPKDMLKWHNAKVRLQGLYLYL